MGLTYELLTWGGWGLSAWRNAVGLEIHRDDVSMGAGESS